MTVETKRETEDHASLIRDPDGGNIYLHALLDDHLSAEELNSFENLVKEEFDSNEADSE